MTTLDRLSGAGASGPGGPDARSAPVEGRPADPDAVREFEALNGVSGGDGRDAGGGGPWADATTEKLVAAHRAHLETRGLEASRVRGATERLHQIRSGTGFSGALKEGANVRINDLALKMADRLESPGRALALLEPGAKADALRAAITPTETDIAAFRKEATVREVIGDSPLLENDEATQALMVELANVRERPGDAEAIARSSALQSFGLDAGEAERLAGTEPVGELSERSERSAEVQASEADEYVAENESAQMDVRAVEGEDGEWDLQFEMHNGEAVSLEDQRALAEINDGLETVSDEVENMPPIVTVNASLTSMSLGSTGSGGEWSEGDQVAGAREAARREENERSAEENAALRSERSRESAEPDPARDLEASDEAAASDEGHGSIERARSAGEANVAASAGA